MIIEKIKIEISEAKENLTRGQIGNYLIERLSNDNVLREKANEQEITLNQVEMYLMNWAKAKANGRPNGRLSIMISSDEVFNELIHAIDEGLIKKEIEEPSQKVKVKKPKVRKPIEEEPLGGLFAVNWDEE